MANCFASFLQFLQDTFHENQPIVAFIDYICLVFSIWFACELGVSSDTALPSNNCEIPMDRLILTLLVLDLWNSYSLVCRMFHWFFSNELWLAWVMNDRQFYNSWADYSVKYLVVKLTAF
jgi:hypothetical protein